ncbi:MAG: hypothetical protein KDB53_21850 [Planctomycetes bacterium]|nr:hypothetical protein [Planctomycetota bacterium]
MSSTQIVFERRLGRLLFGFAAVSVLLILRLGQIQFVEGAGHRKAVEEDRVETIDLPAGRGDILDREGRPLARTVDGYSVSIFPVQFRESNLVDALQDVLCALRPDLITWPIKKAPHELIPAVEARLARYQRLYEAAPRIIPALLSTPTSAFRFDALDLDDLAERMAPVTWPRNELVLPRSKLRYRVVDALVQMAGDERLDTRSALLASWSRSDRLGQALGTDAERCLARLDEERRDLQLLSDELVGGDWEEFLQRLFLRERQDIRRQERRIDEVLHDRVALGRFGTHDLTKIDIAERQALADELGLPNAEPEAITAVWSEYSGLDPAECDPEDKARIEHVVAILEGRAVEALDRAERIAVATALGVWRDDAEALKRALGRRELADSESNRREHLSVEKEWARRLQFKGGVPYQLFRGATFDVACRVRQSFGLSRLGFRVRASFGREYWRDEDGVGVFLLGRLNAEGVPLGGLEAAFSHVAGKPGPIIGTPGVLRRRREPDRGLTELSGSSPPIPGETLRLTIDRDLQQRVEDCLEELLAANPGAVGSCASVIDLATGDILALAQAPRVNGTQWHERWLADAVRTRRRRAALAAARRGGAVAEDLDTLLTELSVEADRNPAYDRAADAGFYTRYPPGSVVKIFGALLLLEKDQAFQPDEVVPTTDRGPVDLHGALVKSSNVYFRHWLKDMGRDAVVSWYESFGLNRPVRWLISPASARARHQVAVGPESALINVAIGQGSLATSVLEVSNMTATLARGGQRREPRILKSVGGREEPLFPPETVAFSPTSLDRVREAMIEIARNKGGADAVATRLAAKTGTTELKGAWGDLNNAYSAGFAPHDAPRIAIAVSLERTPRSGTATVLTLARIAREVLLPAHEGTQR